MSRDRDPLFENPYIREVFREIDRMAFLVSILALFFLWLLYFSLPSFGLSDRWYEFCVAIITNLLPTVLLFDVAYLTFRRFQMLKNDYEQSQIREFWASRLQRLEEEIMASRELIENLDQRLDEVATIQQYYLPASPHQFLSGIVGSANKLKVAKPPSVLVQREMEKRF